MKRIAIVTGASSGIGREFVRLLAEERSIDELWAIARDEEKLARLRAEFGPGVRTISLDLSRREDVGALEELLTREAPRVDWLVNSAGYAKFCSYRELNVDESRNMIDLNVSGVVSVGLACLPHMERGGHMVNIASMASFQPLPYLNLYSATKAFVRNYSRALNVELRERGITVTAVCPGWMATSLYDRASIGAEKGVTRFVAMAEPGPVAEKALRDARKGRDISVYGLYTKTAHFVAKVLPQRAMMRVWLRQQKL
jgi:hypothetical protein